MKNIVYLFMFLFPAISIQAMLSRLNRAKISLSRQYAKRPFTIRTKSSVPQRSNQFGTTSHASLSLQKKPSNIYTSPITETTFWNKFLSFLGMRKKLTFNATYRKENKKILTQAELFAQLKELAQLSKGQEFTIKQEYEYEEVHGNKEQAQIWLLGRLYRDAIKNISTINDLQLLYEAIIMWISLQIESGLPYTPDIVKTEFARLAKKEDEVIHLYDNNSIPIVEQYLKDMKEDLLNEFKQWFNVYQYKRTAAIVTKE